MVATTVSAEEKNRDDYTFGEIEQILVDYLGENSYIFEIGTPKFTEFVINQMNDDTD